LILACFIFKHAITSVVLFSYTFCLLYCYKRCF
jgi:hypothetical protein